MNVWCDAAVNTLGSCNGHFFWGADRIIVSPDEGRTGSDLAPEVSGDHLCRATAVGAINQNTSPAEIKAIIRVVIIVLVNTVPENEMLCESWICLFVVYCIAVMAELLWEQWEDCARLWIVSLFLLCICFLSVWKSWRPWEGFVSLMGLTLSISMAVVVLTDCAVGMCLAGKKMMTVMAMCVFMVLSLRSINY